MWPAQPSLSAINTAFRSDALKINVIGEDTKNSPEDANAKHQHPIRLSIRLDLSLQARREVYFMMQTYGFSSLSLAWRSRSWKMCRAEFIRRLFRIFFAFLVNQPICKPETRNESCKLSPQIVSHFIGQLHKKLINSRSADETWLEFNAEIRKFAFRSWS